MLKGLISSLTFGILFLLSYAQACDFYGKEMAFKKIGIFVFPTLLWFSSFSWYSISRGR